MPWDRQQTCNTKCHDQSLHPPSCSLHSQWLLSTSLLLCCWLLIWSCPLHYQSTGFSANWVSSAIHSLSTLSGLAVSSGNSLNWFAGDITGDTDQSLGMDCHWTGVGDLGQAGGTENPWGMGDLEKKESLMILGGVPGGIVGSLTTFMAMLSSITEAGCWLLTNEPLLVLNLP